MEKEIGWLLKEKYNAKLTRAAKKDIERLKKGEPLDYIIGFTEFLGCKIDLSKKPLIPRPETEFWVERAINEIGNPSNRYARSGQNLRILDIFAGSGCIGIAILKYIKNSNVVFAEKEKNSLEQIKINCKINEITKDKYVIMPSDVFKNISGKFDIIFANPPYIADYKSNPSVRLRTILRNRIQKSVLEHEPKKALFGGKDGLLYIKNFLKNARDFLNDNGKMYMEFDSIQKKKINRLLLDLDYKNFKFFTDQCGKWRYVIISPVS